MKIFDTHIHFNNEKIKHQLPLAINAYPECCYNIVGTTLEDSKKALLLSKKHPNTYCSIGIHPTETKNHLAEDVFPVFHQLLKSNKTIVAIGEIGLDFHHTPKNKCFKLQGDWLLSQFDLAKTYDLPIIFHIRKAYAEHIDFLKQHIDWYGIIHCFDGTVEDLKEYLALGTWMISISPILFRDVERFQKIILLTPLEKLLVETDAPWLTDDYSSISSIIEIIANIKELPIQTIVDQLFTNSLKIFKLDK